MATDPSETRKEELIALTKMTKNNRPENFRAALDYLDRTIINLERVLNNLRSREQYTQQRIRADLSIQEIEENYLGDRNKRTEPFQSYGYFDLGGPDPDEKINFARNSVTRSAGGLAEQIAHQKKAANRIRELQRRILLLRIKKDQINKKLVEISAPKKAELEADRVQKKSAAELFFLYQIHLHYKKYSRDLKSQVKYTENSKIVEKLRILRIRFRAFADRGRFLLTLLGDFEGDSTLDFQNPGADENGEKLRQAIEAFRSISKNDKLEQKVKTYVDELVKDVNDPYVSLRLSSKKVPKLRPPDAISQFKVTQTLSKVFNWTEGVVEQWTLWNQNTYIAAAEKGFYRFLSRLHGQRSFCNNADKSEEGTERQKVQNEKDNDVEQGNVEDMKKRNQNEYFQQAE